MNPTGLPRGSLGLESTRGPSLRRNEREGPRHKAVASKVGAAPGVSDKREAPRHKAVASKRPAAAGRRKREAPRHKAVASEEGSRMLDVVLGSRRVGRCDGVSRRDFLRVGALAGLGLTLPGLL